MYKTIFYDNLYVFKLFKIIDKRRVISFIIETQSGSGSPSTSSEWKVCQCTVTFHKPETCPTQFAYGKVCNNFYQCIHLNT